MFIEREVKAFTRGRPGESLGAEGNGGKCILTIKCILDLNIMEIGDKWER